MTEDNSKIESLAQFKEVATRFNTEIQHLADVYNLAAVDNAPRGSAQRASTALKKAIGPQGLSQDIVRMRIFLVQQLCLDKLTIEQAQLLEISINNCEKQYEMINQWAQSATFSRCL